MPASLKSRSCGRRARQRGLANLIEHPPADTAGVRHRVYNLGNNRSEDLKRFVALLEAALGRKALFEMLPMQPGDVAATYADISESQRDLGFEPKTTIDEGIPRFIAWYRAHHGA